MRRWPPHPGSGAATLCTGALLTAALLGYGCESEGPVLLPAGAAPEPPPFDSGSPDVPLERLGSIGDAIERPGYRFVVHRTRRCETEPYFRPRSGRMKLGVSVAIENTARVPLMVNPFHARAKDDSGETYYFTLAGCKPVLRAARIEPGKKVDGWVTFDVPERARELELHYHPRNASDQSVPVRVRLTLESERRPP